LKKRRVVITGVGVISPIGTGREKYFQSLKEGISGVDHITRFDTEGFDTRIAAEVKDFEPSEYIDKKECRRMDRFTQFAVAASKMAAEDSHIELHIP
jgi:3-oxoacyl-[acyl-carrier-protein] synthase II